MALFGVMCGVFLGFILGGCFEDSAKDSGVTGRNRFGTDIPRVSGMLPVMCLILSAPLMLVSGAVASHVFWFDFAVISMSLVGLADDLLGKKGPRGLRGHLGALKAGVITSGGLKAITGGMVGIAIAMPSSGGLVELVVNGLGFALFSNSINLLDVRPGRALKGFFSFYLALEIWMGPGTLHVVSPLIGGLLVYAGRDFKGEAMMGDVGAAALGATLGFVFLQGEMGRKAWIVAFLFLYHYLAERYSLSHIIDKVSWLRWADGLGVNRTQP